MTSVPSVDAPPRFLPHRSLIVLGTAFALAVLWHLCLPAFFYRNSAVFLEGPLPAVAGFAVALWRHRTAPLWRQLWAGTAWALLAVVATILVFGTPIFGPWDAMRGLYAQVESGFRLPFSALVELRGNPRFAYGFWSGLKPLLLWGGLSYAVWRLAKGDFRERLGGLTSGFRDERAFSREQQLQMKRFRAEYLAAVKAGQPAPSVPPSLIAQSGGSSRLASSYWVLRIVLAIVAFVGVSGSVWSLISGGLEQSVLAIFWRGLLGG